MSVNNSTQRDEHPISVDDSSSKLVDNNHNFKLKMVLNWGKELIIMILILTTYATIIHNAPPKLSRAPTAKPFFPRSSLVSDFPSGILSPTQTKVSISDTSFVLYYAPWCTESQYSRESFDHVARLFHKDAHFAAINCWEPIGECRVTYSKVSSWPVLMAYQPNGSGVQYQRNIWTKSALTKFVVSTLNPIQRLISPDDLLETMTSNDAIVVAFVDVQIDKRQYKSFYQTAFKWLERDPFQEVGFGVVTGETAAAFGVELVPSIRMYLWNETLEYSGNSSWTSTLLSKWINDNIQQVSLWKSSSLAPYFNIGPVLLLFTPRNLYLDSLDSYMMLRQIGMEYYNCNKDNWVQEMAKSYLVQRRKENLNYYKSLRKECGNIMNSYGQRITSPVKRKCTKSISISYTAVLNSSKNMESRQANLLSNVCEVNEKLFPDNCGCDSLKTDRLDSYCVVPTFPTLKNREKFTGEDEVEYRTSMLTSELDQRSAESLKRIHLKRKCELLYLSDNSYKSLNFESAEPENLDEISGLSCQYNQSLSLIAIDSLLYHSYAERLGIDILPFENKTAAIIIDHENESTFRLEGPVNLNTLTTFIENFHTGTLLRFLKTNSVQYKHTHFYNSTDFQPRTAKHSSKPDTEIKIPEINSEEFEEMVIQSNKTVVVLFFTANCAFCSIISHSLMTASKILLPLQPNLTFLRIDGDKNELAWHYTMESFPSLIIFPSNQKSDSRIYPSKMQVTVQNVLGFILANLNRQMRLYGILLTCKSSKRKFSTDDCLTVLQHEITENISNSLREWRQNPSKRLRILRILQLLQNMYLSLLQVKSSWDINNIIENDMKPLSKLWDR